MRFQYEVKIRNSTAILRHITFSSSQEDPDAIALELAKQYWKDDVERVILINVDFE